MSQQWGIFSDESADYTELEAVEAGFWSREEAEEAIRTRYGDEDGLEVHPVEEPDDEDEWDDDEDDDEADGWDDE